MYTCDECGKEFESREDYASHLIDHLEIPEGYKSPKLTQILKLFGRASTDEELVGAYQTFLRGLTFGQKLKTGDITPEDIDDDLVDASSLTRDEFVEFFTKMRAGTVTPEEMDKVLHSYSGADEERE